MLVLAAAAAFSQGKFGWVDILSDDTGKILPGDDPSKVAELSLLFSTAKY